MKKGYLQKLNKGFPCLLQKNKSRKKIRKYVKERKKRKIERGETYVKKKK